MDDYQGPHAVMSRKAKNEINKYRSASYRRMHHNKTVSFNKKDGLYEIALPHQQINKYQKFDISKVREELQNNNFSKATPDQMRKAKLVMSPNPNLGYDNDYFGENYEVFKVNFNKDRVSFTDMKNRSGNFSHLRRSQQIRPNRSISQNEFSMRTPMKSVDNFLPVIHRHRKGIRSPSSFSANDANMDEVLIL